MKNAKFLGLMTLLMMGSTQLMAAPKAQIITLSDVNNQVVQDFFGGNFIIECPEGASLPFKLLLGGQFLTLETANSDLPSLKVLKTYYVRSDGKENFLFSTDLQNWKGFLEFFTGELKVSVDVENGEPVAGLQLELNQK